MNQGIHKKDEVSDLLSHGERLRYARIKKGYSQEYVANKANIKQSMISGYERNTKGGLLMCIPTMIALSEVLDVSLDWILTGKEKNAFIDGKLLALSESENYAPVLSWQEIHSWKFLNKENRMHSNQHETVKIYGKDVNNCFAIKLDHSNYAQSHPFHKDDVIIVDSVKEREIDNYVVVSHDNGENIGLRQFVHSHEGECLQKLDCLDFEFITEETIFYGVVVGQYRTVS